MGRDEELPTVDFVVGDPFGAPTGGLNAGRSGSSRVVDRDAPELPEGGDSAPAGPRWGRRLLAVGVVAAAVVAAAVHGRGQHAPTTASTPAVSSSAAISAASSASAPTPLRDTPVSPEITTSLIQATGGVANIAVPQLPIAPSMPPCPQADDGQSACSTVHTVPAAFTAAVLARFPHARQLSAISVQLRNSGPQSRPGLVWSRSYSARADRVSIVVTVEDLKLDEPARAGVRDDGSRTVVFSERSSGGHLVVVETSAPSGSSPWLGEVNALARDRRLVAI